MELTALLEARLEEMMEASRSEDLPSEAGERIVASDP